MMTPDELQRHGLRVKPLDWGDSLGEERFRDALDIDHAVDICAALEPLAPPDVAQAARILLEWWNNVEDGPTLSAAIGVVQIMGETQEQVDRFPAALRAIAMEVAE